MLLGLWMGCAPSGPGLEPIGPEGGVLQLDGVRLQIPAGALHQPTLVHLKELGEPPSEHVGLSPLYTVHPEGLQLQVPATLSVAHRPNPAAALLVDRRGEGFSTVESVAPDPDVLATGMGELRPFFVALRPAETVELPYASAVDVLFVVETPSAMSDPSAQIMDQALVPLQALQQVELDFRLGVLLADMTDPSSGQGKLRNVAGRAFVDAETVGAEQMFPLMLSYSAVGYPSTGRAAAWTMIEEKAQHPRNQDFYRPEAELELVFVSWRDDASGTTPVDEDTFVGWMQTLKSAPDMVTAHAITATSPDCATPHGFGDSYMGYATATSGESIDLCTASWEPLFEAIATRPRSARVQLPSAAERVFTVEVPGTEERYLPPQAYSVDGDVLTIAPGYLPQASGRLWVSYRPASQASEEPAP